ncbi:MAG: S24/S26 family peptidase [Nitrospira sp.]
MIARLLSPSAPSTRFSADQLPEAVHGSLFQEIINPIVNSESMTPTLQKGDVLRLQNAEDLQVGDVVVYRHGRLFVCHRVHRIQGLRLFLRGDANTGPFEEIELRQVVGRVETLLRHGAHIPVRHDLPELLHIQRDSMWARTATWTLALGRVHAFRFVNWVTDRPVIRKILRHILKRLMTIDLLTRGSLHSLQGYIARHHVHLDQTDDLQRHLSTLNGEDIMLVIRAGPIYFGTCTLNPWDLYMRPLLQDLTTVVLYESISPFLPPHISSLPVLTSTPSRGKQ